MTESSHTHTIKFCGSIIIARCAALLLLLFVTRLVMGTVCVVDISRQRPERGSPTTPCTFFEPLFRFFSKPRGVATNFPAPHPPHLSRRRHARTFAARHQYK